MSGLFAGYLLIPKSTGTETISKWYEPKISLGDKFQIILDVQHFKPEEIHVKLNGRTICIEAKHEEKSDNQGYISRHFIRKYILPPDYDLKKIHSTLTSDGILIVTAPKIDDNRKNVENKVIPVSKIDKPFAQISNQQNIKLKHKL